MLNFTKLEDITKTRQAFKKDDLFKEMLSIDDISDWIPKSTEAVILVHEDQTALGLLFLQELDNNYVCLHAGVYEDQRHKQSLRLLKKCTKKIKRILFPRHLCTMAKETNKAACKLIEAAGYKYKTTKQLDNINFRLYVE